MFVLNEILNFGIGRRQEAWDRLAWIHSTMAPHDGFIEAIVAKYLGESHRHTIMRFWRDQAAFEAFRATPDGSYGKGRPAGIYEGEKVVTPLNSIADVDGPAQGNFLVKVQHAVEESAWPAFIEYQMAVKEVGSQIPGLVWARQCRGRDENAAIAVVRFQDRESWEQLVDDPMFVASTSNLPEGVTVTRTEAFEIVSDVLPAK